jgi:hypothetical protein
LKDARRGQGNLAGIKIRYFREIGTSDIRLAPLVPNDSHACDMTCPKVNVTKMTPSHVQECERQDNFIAARPQDVNVRKSVGRLHAWDELDGITYLAVSVRSCARQRRPVTPFELTRAGAIDVHFSGTQATPTLQLAS